MISVALFRSLTMENAGLAQSVPLWMIRGMKRLSRCLLILFTVLGLPLLAADEILTELRTKADKGEAAAQNTLGVMYRKGEDMTKDPVEAVKWFRKAAEQGYALAQFNLGLMYFKGEGVTKDPVEAIKWYRKAANQDHADALGNLGWMYYEGEGVTKDLVEAFKWYRKAADQGDAHAQNSLGVMYSTPEIDKRLRQPLLPSVTRKCNPVEESRAFS